MPQFSSPGDGPRRKMRDEDAARFNFASEFVKGRVTAIKGDMGALDAELAKIVSNDASTIDAATGTRNEFMRSLGRRLDMTVTGFNAFRTDPQLRQIRTDLADRAERTTIDDGQRQDPSPAPTRRSRSPCAASCAPSTSCPTWRSRRSPPSKARKPPSRPSAASRRRSSACLSFELPPSADELRQLQQKAVQSIDNPAALHALSNEAVGLSKRDYIPLGVAVFVDLCLLLVSIGRPMNRFVATRQSMIEAERGPVFPILSRFSEIHNHEEMRRTFDVFREVIFESGGTYYVAVPLNAPRGHPQREQLRRDAQALANLCYALEGQGVLTRPWKIAPGLVARRKLRRQGSKFIECYRDNHVAPMPRAGRALMAMFISDRKGEERPAFRIYAFKNGAWPEMILGAVMGAAGRIEAERRRQQQVSPAVEEVAEVRAEFERSLSERGAINAARRRAARVSIRDLMVRRRARPNIFKHRPGAVHEPADAAATRCPWARRSRSAGASPLTRTADATADKAYRQRFGNYAGLAEAELTTYRDLEDDAPDHANSNTARTAPADEEEAVVVPFPAPCRRYRLRAPPSSFAERIATALAPRPRPNQAMPRPTIGVELRRETATFHVPVSEASLPEALMKLTGGALRIEAETPAWPQLEHSLAGSITGDRGRRNAGDRAVRRISFHRNSMARTSNRHACCAGWWNKPLSEHARSARGGALRNTCLTEMSA